MSDFLLDILIPFITPLMVIGTIAIILFSVTLCETKGWNDGYCECGGKWVYRQVIDHKYSIGYLYEGYIYECDKCGKLEEFDVHR